MTELCKIHLYNFALSLKILRFIMITFKHFGQVLTDQLHCPICGSPVVEIMGVGVELHPVSSTLSGQCTIPSHKLLLLKAHSVLEHTDRESSHM